jgi:predicted DNA-binding transcriptional regulator AlpA
MAKITTIAESSKLLPDPQVATRYGVTSRTIDRWDERPALGFPPAIRINNRKYRRVGELELWEKQRAAASLAPEAA